MNQEPPYDFEAAEHHEIEELCASRDPLVAGLATEAARLRRMIHRLADLYEATTGEDDAGVWALGWAAGTDDVPGDDAPTLGGARSGDVPTDS